MQVLVGVERKAEDLADRLRGLLRAPERARHDRLDPLALQALARAPRACSQPRSDSRSAPSGSACIVRSATLATDSPWRVK